MIQSWCYMTTTITELLDKELKFGCTASSLHNGAIFILSHYGTNPIYYKEACGQLPDVLILTYTRSFYSVRGPCLDMQNLFSKKLFSRNLIHPQTLNIR